LGLFASAKLSQTKTRAGTIKFHHLSKLENATIIEMLTRIKAIGVWTVHMF
jgi:3-methyladenine DNA glycosylase/8-oxoguanine DNA glycosylase